MLERSELCEQVTSGCRVLADVTIKLKDGSVADSTKVHGKPSWLILGDGSFSEAFESNLIGAKIDDKLTFELGPADAFGESVPDNIHFMDISQFPQDVKLEKGAIVSFEQPNGNQLPGIIREILGTSVKVDFNHPLAGETVIFELEIKQIAA
ncbi:FKBP-type peptidyl-prolyl cis-trans isomerase [Aliikangiella coralliicola]|uniref:Peptidyl-prolyl cis-trans isomerase n=1 Tax=Aliikangiella coralliicola TaxID=2592383 RepID=A0A545UAA2_9GAMM|nr:FKBP-type peptidyl-prolyl cis-trans isomerase [Aliikangiella coralliicola]TQV86401.1 FKBP-type peptidyl-prolyl cis-trans isomerase [Aliikangiella coralliicola]